MANQGEPVRLRRSIQVMWAEYGAPNSTKKKPIEDLIRAWAGIQELSHRDPDNEHSIFKIGGFHGSPFRGAGYANSQWWGGWCHHGNVLFPTWHRVYCLRLENALRSIKGCEDVTLPYWHETGSMTELHGVPEIFTLPEVPLDGEMIPNPLFSYTLPVAITDHVHDHGIYTKPKGYETCRYPFSGLKGTPEAVASTLEHNAQFTAAQGTEQLNSNIRNWLNQSIEVLDTDGRPDTFLTGTRMKFASCLDAPNYTVFSNITSATAWNDTHIQEEHVLSIESPHDDIHLALGGFDVPSIIPAADAPNFQENFSHVPGANGDMGDNDTAAFDPIFFFHHTNIDRYFWNWQRHHNSTHSFSIIAEYPGTNTVDSQGPTPGLAGGSWLSLDTELKPFVKDDGSYYRSTDTFHIIEQMGYTYDDTPLEEETPVKKPTAAVRVSGVKKGSIAGSATLAVFLAATKWRGKATSSSSSQAKSKTSSPLSGTAPPQFKLIGLSSVLSRLHTSDCANCLINNKIIRYVPVYGVSPEELKDEGTKVVARIITHETSGGEAVDWERGFPRGDKWQPIVHVVGKGQRLADVRPLPSMEVEEEVGDTSLVESVREETPWLYDVDDR